MLRNADIVDGTCNNLLQEADIWSVTSPDCNEISMQAWPYARWQVIFKPYDGSD
jgi:hypothetical protein